MERGRGVVSCACWTLAHKRAQTAIVASDMLTITSSKCNVSSTNTSRQLVVLRQGNLKDMENPIERFFKGFSLEGYRLQVLMNKLEKEKKQCLNRLREETHVFKMSVKPLVKCGEQYSQYGERFHANGDKRETSSITHVNMEHNEEGWFLFSIAFSTKNFFNVFAWDSLLLPV